MRGVFGYAFHDNFAVEGMHGFGVKKGQLESNGYSIRELEFKTDQLFGIYLVPKARFSDNFEGFARIGAAHVKAKLETPWGSTSDSESGFSYGVGIRYNITKQLSVSTDYMSYYQKSKEKIHGLALNIGFRF